MSSSAVAASAHLFGIAGYMLAVFMGLTLGLIGAGGSILTVPILVYLLGVQPLVATGYSLLVVGCAALAGAVRYWRRRLVNIRAACLFALPAMLAVLATRTYLVPAIPDPLAGVPKDVFIMLLFSLLMVTAALFMLRPLRVARAPVPPALTTKRVATLVVGSAGVGLLTGLVGAGGGFLIIPTLISLFGLPVKEAIGTSLTIIAVNSLAGFKGDLMAGIPLDLPLLLTFLLLTLLGMWLGTALSSRMDSARLKTLFAVFTLIVGLCVFTQEAFALLHR